MGSWSVSCGISNIAITSGNKCVLLPLKKNRSNEEGREWQPATLPIFGKYNDYGGIENIEKDDNTEFIEKHFEITTGDFCEFLVDGKFTYDRDEAKAIAKRIKNLDEMKSWRFMWIDRQVYDFMITNQDEYHKGYMDYGTPEMLKLLGFKFVKKSNKLKNYDPTRFNQLWKKGNFEVYSDGSTILTSKGMYVYHFGKGKDNETSLEHYIDVPKELEYLKEKGASEVWRLMSNSKAKSELGWILGSRYDFSDMEDFRDDLLTKMGKLVKMEPTILYKKYMADLDRFGDRIVHLKNLIYNLHPMSGQLAPFILYLTPQWGEYERHQKILEKFVEINRSYCQHYEG